MVFPLNATHKTPEVKGWLEKHPCFKLHFTPTSASWLNLVERFFAEITSKPIRRGSYASVGDLETAIYGVCQRSCPPISCGVSDFGGADFAFRVEPDGSCGLPVAGFA